MRINLQDTLTSTIEQEVGTVNIKITATLPINIARVIYDQKKWYARFCNYIEDELNVISKCFNYITERRSLFTFTKNPSLKTINI